MSDNDNSSNENKSTEETDKWVRNLFTFCLLDFCTREGAREFLSVINKKGESGRVSF